MIRYLLAAWVLVLLPGCNVLPVLFPGLFGTVPGNTDPNIGDPTGSAKLQPFESAEALDEYFTGQVGTRNEGLIRFADPVFFEDGNVALSPGDGGAAPGAAPEGVTSLDRADAGSADGADSSATAESFSGTTTQEQGVDEADVVKTDGTYLYIIANSTLRIVQAVPADGLAAVAEVPLEGYGRDIYLQDHKVIALTEIYGGFFYGGGVLFDGVMPMEGAVAEEAMMMGPVKSDVTVSANDILPEFDRPKTIVTVIDVQQPAAPRVLSTTKFDGTPASSRMVDGVLHLVIANFQHFFFDVMPMLGRPELDVSTVTTEMFLPTFQRVDAEGGQTSGPVVTWRELYRPTDPDGFGIVTVVSLDITKDAAFSAAGVVAEPGLIYASTEALYLTDTNWDFFGNTRETTDIYKFSFRAEGTVPVAMGTVAGRILNQYSMGEYKGHLRVATTTGGGAESINAVYILEEKDGELSVTGSVKNIAPRETIQSARFLGDRGFVVTFEQIDPLFTLDLSDPATPRIAGELKVPGFSTFLVPMDENHLLAVGQYIPDSGDFLASSGVQLSIFDITNFADPMLKHNVVIGGDVGAYSEALNDPKAFTYFVEDDLVALPISIYDGPSVLGETDIAVGVEASDHTDGGVVEPGPNDPVPDEPMPDGPVDPAEPIDSAPDPSEPPVPSEPFQPGGFDGLFVYRAEPEGGFTELGRLSTRFEESGFFWSSFTRGVFIGNNVFAVTDTGVRGAPIEDIASTPYELLLGSPDTLFFGESGAGDSGSSGTVTPSTDEAFTNGG